MTVNGQAVSADLIGTNVQDGERGVQRLTYVGVPIRSGPNTISFLGQQLRVSRVGATARIVVTPLQLSADGSSPIRLKMQTFDAFGQVTEQPSLTLTTNLEPLTPDSNPGESGHQLKLLNGEGVLELQPQSAPTTLRLSVLHDAQQTSYTYDLRPDQSRVGVGLISVTAGLDGPFSVQSSLSWKAQAYYEGPLAGGKLYLAADKDGLPRDENTLLRSPVYGDASTESVPLQGLDPLAFTYDHPSFRADYRRSALPIEVLPLGEELTALTVSSKGPTRVSGFVALVPEDRVSNLPLPLGGLRVVHLPDQNISEGSDTLELVTLERGTGKELKRQTLLRNTDYVLDYRSGVITLARALDHVDLNLNEQELRASYRRQDPLASRQPAYGAQLTTSGRHYTAGVAAVNIDHTLTLGARAAYDNGTTQASTLLAYSGGVQVSADLSSKPTARQSFGAKLRYQDGTYQGLGRFNDGLSVTATATTRLTERVSTVIDAEYHRTPQTATPVGAAPSATLPATTPNSQASQGGSITARADYQFAPFRAGLGGKYAFGDQYGLGLVGSAGYHQGRVDIDVTHTQPISGNLNATTDLSTTFRVARNVNLGFTDKLTWGVGHAAALTLDTMIGNVNYAAAYELPSASGQGNRARFSVQTTLPLGPRLSLGVRGSALYSLQDQAGELGAGADLNYKTDRLSATLGSDVSSTAKGFGVVVRGGLTGSLGEHLTLSADGLLERGQGKSGQRLSLGYAYRQRSLVSLGYARYTSGTLAAIPELSAGLSAEYRQPAWAVRGSLDTRSLLNDAGSTTWQAGVGATAYLTPWLGLGAWGRMIGQPASGVSALGYGVEGSVRALPGTWLSAGYNFKGFEGLPSAGSYTKRGLYLRLDLTVDETLGGKR
ncbi:hypothetical protein D3875_11565 [Deinococcus cavernae]|uniref:Uncharacterized protein n=1 Tax=Deinococcus cavernae TaxID=2320857 RepID=A0A418VC16_9DEIO|nr:hypothetical protein D3875_11565 [Deinococcus cavernae]